MARPNRVRYPTDCTFTSRCSPPRLAATQLRSVTGRSVLAWRGLTPLGPNTLAGALAHGVSRGEAEPANSGSPGGATETGVPCRHLPPLRGYTNLGLPLSPRLTPWATLCRPSGAGDQLPDRAWCCLRPRRENLPSSARVPPRAGRLRAARA